MKLFASLTSPYARKIRILLAEKGLPFELVVDSPWEANTRIPTLNPLGKVPVLITDDGEAFFDSPVIAGYLETLGAQPAMLPADALEAVRVRQIEALADGVTDAAVAALLESRRPDGQRSDAEIVRQKDKIERSLVELEKRADGHDWLHGERFGLADVAAAVALAYLDLRHPDLDWRARHPALKTYADRLFARPSFIDTKPPVG
ncbi:glutathione S-transferase [Thauera sp. CAU 1555]|uniref:Glutathione S-transferase n=1 Tax=Thauera sedimentorum TaxID=2767595 RepID=A0ABR9BAI2_9RHOO|nr:glutathione S-transferase [Thauera sedimentorum]MBC9072434.1 glutathione S-transferase [Thauera sedimentorum]MBD8503353.1 glutathione S-transferase [Thauera sedimentorum]